RAPEGRRRNDTGGSGCVCQAYGGKVTNCFLRARAVSRAFGHRDQGVQEEQGCLGLLSEVSSKLQAQGELDRHQRKATRNPRASLQGAGRSVRRRQASIAMQEVRSNQAMQRTAAILMLDF